MIPAPAALPDGLLLSFYGDDFTGSSAVMEVLTFAGLPTVLFLDIPTPAQRARFGAYRAIGIAGVARAQSPAWMAEHLPPQFRALASLGAPIAHYKVCSTFDSAPHVGSIGCAADLAVPILGGAWHPMVVAAPGMARYQAFGNLFASVGGCGYRLDRHPTMARHPVTPMDEGDIRVHLAKQTDKPIGLVDLVALKTGQGEASLAGERQRHEIIAFDVLDEETLAETGRLIWDNRGDRLFAIGSQGLQYALVAHWRRAGLIPAAATEAFRAKPHPRIVCVSGSCSPVTAGQIEFAGKNGFTLIRLDAARAVDPAAWQRETGRAVDLALAALGDGADPLIYTAAGPDDPAIGAMRAAIGAAGVSADAVNARVGTGLGAILAAVRQKVGLGRAVIAGGDTSGFAAQQLGIYALTALAPIAPGSPLCRAHAAIQGDGHAEFEIALKGGQVGQPDFFLAAKLGTE